MFVKFKRDLEGAVVSDVRGCMTPTVPSESVIFETQYVKYTKKPCPPKGMQGPCHVVFEDPTEVEGEYLEVVITDHFGKALWLYVADSGSRVGDGPTMFVMNDQGKTVDSISCA